MAEKRKQHFVPKLLLRHFAEGKLVNIMKMEDGEIITDASYESQCQIKYFYGKEGMEDILAEIETIAAPIIDKIIEGDILEINDVFPLLFFIALQITRTEKDVVTFSHNTSKIFNEISELANMNPRYSPETFSSPVMHIRTASARWPMLTDLKFGVLRNNTNVPFILSDNPVIRYNQYYRNDDIINQTGITCKGLIIILPIDLNTAIILFDNEVYRLNLKKNNIINIEDVRKINELQTLNANKVLISHPKTIFKELKKYYNFRILNPPIECASVSVKADENKYLVSRPYPKLNFKKELSFIEYINGDNFKVNNNRKIQIREKWINGN